MLNTKEIEKEEILNNIGELNEFFNKFKKFNLKKVSDNKGATEKDKVYTGGKFNIFFIYRSDLIREEPVFLLESIFRFIRSSPIVLIQYLEVNKLHIRTENSVYQLEMLYEDKLNEIY